MRDEWSGTPSHPHRRHRHPDPGGGPMIGHDVRSEPAEPARTGRHRLGGSGTGTGGRAGRRRPRPHARRPDPALGVPPRRLRRRGRCRYTKRGRARGAHGLRAWGIAGVIGALAIADRLAGRTPRPYRYHDDALHISLGRRDGIVQLGTDEDSRVLPVAWPRSSRSGSRSGDPCLDSATPPSPSPAPSGSDHGRPPERKDRCRP